MPNTCYVRLWVILTESMDASIQGALAQINRSWKAFTHKGKPMTKEQVTKVLVYANNKGYKSTSQLSDNEIDEVLNLKL